MLKKVGLCCFGVTDFLCSIVAEWKITLKNSSKIASCLGSFAIKQKHSDVGTRELSSLAQKFCRRQTFVIRLLIMMPISLSYSPLLIPPCSKLRKMAQIIICRRFKNCHFDVV